MSCCQILETERDGTRTTNTISWILANYEEELDQLDVNEEDDEATLRAWLEYCEPGDTFEGEDVTYECID